MNDDNTRDAATPSPASAGSHGEPVAWLIHADGWQMVSLFREHADAAADENDAEVLPLYRSPALTDEEREAIERLCEAVAEYSEIDRKGNGCHADDDMAAVAVARRLLEGTKTVGPAPAERPGATRVADVGGSGPT